MLCEENSVGIPMRVGGLGFCRCLSISRVMIASSFRSGFTSSFDSILCKGNTQPRLKTVRISYLL